ncbi:hypothetical protein IFM89_014265 [Coptis chinensis]|uniref:FAR1 domain-containing protein n=1 Tax=Coptis chinensis TaxID=261450 RepID=A0A835H567_9MAGN|nr:hypothetical protein IFM89_014265 [Coptis chinensis]
MVDISNEDRDWATNMCNDACPYEESDSSDTEINIVEGSTNVSLEDEDESDDHSVSEIEGFEGQSNEADARSEQTNENDFDLFSGKLGGEDLDENAIMFSMRFKTSNEAFEFYNEYAKVVGFSVRKGVYRFHKDIPVKRNFVCSCQGPSTNSKRVRKCARSADLSEEEEIHSMSGVYGFVATENSDKNKGRSRISKCGNCSETGHTKTTCTWPKPQSQEEEERMGVFTFVRKSSRESMEWKADSGDLEASTSSTFELQRKLVQAALSPTHPVVFLLPFLLSLLLPGCLRGINGKYKVSVDPPNGLTKLQEASSIFMIQENRQDHHRDEVRKELPFQHSKDTPRLSYDGREIPRSSFDSRDTFKSNTKLRELPRLSLDSRQSSMRGSKSDSKSNSFLGDFQNGGGNSNRTSNTHQRLESHKHNHSVVAKLMGLEAIPKSLAANEGSTRPTRTSIYPGGNHDSLSKSSRTTSDCKKNSISPRNYLKESVSPRLRNPDVVTKPLPNSRFPVEADG